MDVRVCEASLRVPSNISLLQVQVHRAPSTSLSLSGPRRDSKVSVVTCKSAVDYFLLEPQIHRIRRPLNYGGIPKVAEVSCLSTSEFTPQFHKRSILTSLRRPHFESTPKFGAGIRIFQPGRSACHAVPDEQSPGDIVSLPAVCNPEQPQRFYILLGAARIGEVSGVCRKFINAMHKDVETTLPPVWYFAVANAESLMLGGTRLESVLQDGIERAERAKRPRDVWLIMEPTFLSEHPGLKALNARLTKPTVAIVSTNGDWMLSFVKASLPQVVIGKFLSPSAQVPDPLKSSLNCQGALIGGGGVWH